MKNKVKKRKTDPTIKKLKAVTFIMYALLLLLVTGIIVLFLH